MNTIDDQATLAQAPTLRDALDLHGEYFARRVAAGGRSPATLAMHQEHAKLLLRVLPPSLELAAINDTHVDQVVEAAGDVSGATIRKRLSTLYGALGRARRRGLLRELPLRPEVDYRYVPTTSHLRDLVELRRLCAQLPASRAEWVTAAVYTGMHAGDLNLWRAWLDCDPFERWMVLYNRKNRAIPIRVRMPLELARVLRARFASVGLQPGQPALRTWDHGTRGHQLRAAAAAAGVDAPNATALRHTCGTWIVRRNGITPAAARWLGHRSTSMLERVYAHALPLQLEELTAELDSMEVEGARARRPPRKASRKRVGNPPRSTVERSGPGGADNTAGPGKRRRETRAALGSDHSVSRRPNRVPRDRVELSTHGFSVDGDAPSDAGARAAHSVASKKERPPCPHHQQHRHRRKGSASSSPTS